MFIKKNHLLEFQNEEHAGFHTYVQEYMNEDGIVSQKVESQSANHKLKLAIEKTVLDLVQKNSYNTRVSIADAERDKPIRGFNKVVKGMLNHFNPEVAQAAYNVNLINVKFRDITYLSDEKQTPAEESYLTALKAVMADIITLGLTDWLTEMETTENAFVAVVKNRNNEDDIKPAMKMKVARVETDVTFDAITSRINAFITIEGDADYANFVTKLNNRIDQYNNIIAQRKGIAAAKKKAESATVTK